MIAIGRWLCAHGFHRWVGVGEPSFMGGGFDGVDWWYPEVRCARPNCDRGES